MTTRNSWMAAATAATLCIVVAFAPSATDAYVTNKSALPTPRQLQYLKQITGEICDAPPGELTDSMIADSHQILKGWTRLSKTAESVHSSSNNKTKKRNTYNNNKKDKVVVVPSKDNAVASENLLRRLVQEARAGNPQANPTVADYNCILETWGRSNGGVFAAERCEAILTQMQNQYELEGDRLVQPNLSSFKICIMAWKHAGGDSLSSFRAQRVLEWMINLYDTGKNDLAFPDQMCFDSVLQSWSRNTHKQAPNYAEKLLGTMETLSNQEETGYPHRIRPRTLSYNAILGAWSRASPNHSSTSNFKVTGKGSNNNSYGDSKAWLRACDVLSFMENDHFVEGNQDVAPDLVSYHIVTGALARSGNPDAAPKADKILKYVEKQHKEGILSFKPDTFLFNSAMGCWAHSNKKGAWRKARSILDRQISYFNQGTKACKPDVFGFTSVISTCASESGNKDDKAKAFNVALSTFRQLSHQQEEYGSPNEVTYGAMLGCVAKLLPFGSPERKKWTKKLFRECAANGMVGGMVLARVKEASSSNQEYKELMSGHTKGSFPKSWSRNVENNQRRPRKAFVGKRATV
ncbi:MAG: hypothetical protein SGARI_001520 [Bacillariaceae sp.]